MRADYAAGVIDDDRITCGTCYLRRTEVFNRMEQDIYRIGHNRTKEESRCKPVPMRVVNLDLLRRCDHWQERTA